MTGAFDAVVALLLYGVVATAVVEALLHWVPVEAPAARFPYHISALLAPIVLLPTFAMVVPARQEDWFRDVSVFVSARWELVRVGPVDLRSGVFAVAAAGSALLLLRDLVHLATDAWRVRRHEALLPRVEPPEQVQRTVAALSSQLGLAAPPVDLLVWSGHTLHCRGWRRPRIVMSTGTLADVTADELQASLAHELAHVYHDDVGRSWLLLALRALQWFNPFAQALGRRAAHELEWRADDRAVRLTGRPVALAHALVRCARRRGDRFLGLSGQGRFRTMEQRCRRLVAGADAPDSRCGAEMVLLWGGLATLLVFVQ